DDRYLLPLEILEELLDLVGRPNDPMSRVEFGEMLLEQVSRKDLVPFDLRRSLGRPERRNACSQQGINHPRGLGAVVGHDGQIDSFLLRKRCYQGRIQEITNEIVAVGPA